jgi:hypothetical protein
MRLIYSFFKIGRFGLFWGKFLCFEWFGPSNRQISTENQKQIIKLGVKGLCTLFINYIA